MVAGVDVGGSMTKACIVSGTDALASASLPTSLGAPDDLGDRALAAVTEAMKETDHRGQTNLVRRLSGLDAALITVSMREPQDLGVYPETTTHVCSDSSHQPSVDAMVGAIFGESAFLGRLPVAIPGLYESGHGL